MPRIVDSAGELVKPVRECYVSISAQLSSDLIAVARRELRPRFHSLAVRGDQPVTQGRRGWSSPSTGRVRMDGVEGPCALWLDGDLYFSVTVGLEVRQWV